MNSSSMLQSSRAGADTDSSYVSKQESGAVLPHQANQQGASAPLLQGKVSIMHLKVFKPSRFASTQNDIYDFRKPTFSFIWTTNLKQRDRRVKRREMCALCVCKPQTGSHKSACILVHQLREVVFLVAASDPASFPFSHRLQWNREIDP